MSANPPDIYSGQHRGSESDYDRYFAGMDKTMQQKLAFTAAHFMLKPGAVIADMGCGSGLGSYQFAQLNPDVRVIGIDINPEIIRIAREHHRLPNLQFEIGDIEQPDAALGPFDGILNSSVLHHVYSFTGYDKASVTNSVRNQFDCLSLNGMMVIRDFCAWPDDQHVLLDLPAKPGGDYISDMSDADLLVHFSTTARGAADSHERGFFLEEVASTGLDWRRFRVSAKWANEFILRKDYREDWAAEVLEEYSWWTPADYRRELTALGGRVVYAAPFWNSWIVDNRYKGNVRIFDENARLLGFPPTNYIAVVEKVAPGASLFVGERLVSRGPRTYLYKASYTDGEEIYDLVARPGDVVDCLPYLIVDGRLHILAKHGYPRPLANTVARGTANLDGKHWSGHMVEPIAVGAQPDGILPLLAERTGLDVGQFAKARPGISYYPSSAMVDELVTSLFVPLEKSLQPRTLAAAGFVDGGDIRLYPAQDLLRAAQVGILPEARLELNIYALMREQGIKPDTWLSGVLPLPKPITFSVSPLKELLQEEPVEAYRPSPVDADFLEHKRSSFTDRCEHGKTIGTQELEFVIPKEKSCNVASVVVLARDPNGEIYIGLEKRQLPTPQLREGNSQLLTLPAYRLGKNLDSLEVAAEFIAGKLGQSPSVVSTLGEGYFSSIGLTPERVYPFVAMVDPVQMVEPMHFVPLREMFQKIESLRDAHLLIAGFRAIHALGLWAEYVFDTELKPAAPMPMQVPTGLRKIRHD